MSDGMVPEGYIRNCYGDLVRIDRVRPELIQEDAVVRDLIARAEALQQQIMAFKARAFDDIGAHAQLLDERYHVKVGGRRGGMQLASFDGCLKVSIATEDSITFGPELRQAKALIDGCLMRWSAGANANLVAVIEDAFAVGEKGKVRVDRVLGLRRLEIDDEEWKRAMTAIGDAVRTSRSKVAIRFYKREAPEQEYRLIVLDVARVP
jgi:hypothetical protein